MDEGGFGVHRPARNEPILEAGRRLEDALAAVRPAAKAAAEVMRELAPEHLELQFGVKPAGKAGAIIARNCSGAHFTVKMSFTAPAVPLSAPEDEIRP